MYSLKINASVLTLFISLHVNAQLLSDTNRLAEVEIIENRLNSKLSSSSQNIQVLNAEFINRSSARSLNEVLSYVPGVDVRQRGPLGSQADISLRGGTFEQTLLLVNGIKLTDPQTGHHGLNIPIPLSAIDRVDVLKGPAARIYGQNAFTGAINIITEPSKQRQLEAQVVAGDFNLRGANLVLNLPFKKIRQSISGAYSSSTGYWHNTDFVNGNLLYDAALNVNTHSEWRVMAAYLKKDMGANGYYSNRFPDQWESTETGLLSVSLDQHYSKLKLQWRAYLRRNHDEFRLKRFEPEFYTNFHLSHVTAMEMNGVYHSKFGQTGFGLDARREDIVSSNLGNHQRDLLGLFVEHKAVLSKKLDVRAGLYANYYSQYGLKYFPGFEAGYQIGKRSRLYTNTGISYRIPTYTELYYTDPSTSANSDLKLEQASSLEFGYRYLKSGLRLEANVFYRHASQLIDYYRPDDGQLVNTAKWTPRNISEADVMGSEWQISDEFEIKDSVFAVQKLGLSYNYLFAQIAVNKDIQTRYALDHYQHQAILNLQFLLLKRLSLGASVRYLQRVATTGYFVADLKLSYRAVRQMTAFVEWTNISNTKYVEAGYVQMPGRWLKIGLQLKLQKF